MSEAIRNGTRVRVSRGKKSRKGTVISHKMVGYTTDEAPYDWQMAPVYKVRLKKTKKIVTAHESEVTPG